MAIQEIKYTYSQGLFSYLSEGRNRYAGFVGGFGSGKTFAGANEHLLDIPENRGFDSIIAAPTQKMLERVTYPQVLRCLDDYGWGYKIFRDRVNPRIELPEFKSIIYFESLHEPATLVGTNVSHLWIDEIDRMKMAKAKQGFDALNSRVRVGKKNKVRFSMTPEGHNFGYHFLEKKGWPYVQGKSYENENCNQDYILSLFETYTPEMARAYIMGEWVPTFDGTVVYHKFNSKKHHSKLNKSYAKKFNSYLTIGMDFNVREMSAIIFVEDPQRNLHAIDEIIGTADTDETCQAILARYPWIADYDDNGRVRSARATVYPDSTGKNPSSKGINQTDFKIIKKYGFIIDAPRKNPYIRDRVNCVNGQFENARGEARLYVNTNTCPCLTESLQSQVISKASGQPEKKKYGSYKVPYDGPNDAFGYPVHRKLGLPGSYTESNFISLY